MKLIKNLGMLYPTEKSKQKIRYGIYKCPVCSKEFKTQTHRVKRGDVTKCKSCASRIKNTTHGFSYHKLYNTWMYEKDRCCNPNNNGYKNYGGRGIKVSEEFNDFTVWLEYIESLNDAYADGYTIDRIDNDGNYERGNLRWASKNVQSRNTRKIRSHNTSGYRGVTWNKKCNKWQARIGVNNKSISLGYFKDAVDAAYAYDSYIIKHNLEHTINFEKLYS